MKRIGRIVIGGIREKASTNGFTSARTHGMNPAATPRIKEIGDGNAHAAGEPPEADGGVRPEKIIAGALVLNEHEFVHGVHHLRDGGKDFVGGVDAETLVAADAVGDGECDERQGGEQVRRARGWDAG